MQRHYPSIPFERYADDIIVHCKNERQAIWLKSAVVRRLAQCKLNAVDLRIGKGYNKV